MTPIERNPEGVEVRTIAGKQTIFSIIDHYLRAGAFCQKLVFPEAGLDERELTAVARWAEGRISPVHPKGWLVIGEEGAGIVIVPWDEDLLEVAVKTNPANTEEGE